MKLILIILSTLALDSCGTKKNTVSSENTIVKEMVVNDVKSLKEVIQEEDPLVVYDSHTRGYHFTFAIYETYATVIKEYQGNPRKVAVLEEDIIALKNVLADVLVAEIASYEAPTKLRHHDAAPHTSITIFKNGKKYSSKTFDGGHPPKELAVLVNKVLSLSTEK